jgi:AraC-like DNA-binding protein
MDSVRGDAIDVTEILAQALPAFLSDWRGAKLYLVLTSPSTAARLPVRTARKGSGLTGATLARIGTYIDAELANPITLHQLASIAGLSRCYFSRAFKQSTGLPPHRYLIERRIERSVEMIRQTARPLSQIALEVGFYDQSHFSRQIARFTGKTPRELRRESGGPTSGSACSSRALWPGAGRPTVRTHAGE